MIKGNIKILVVEDELSLRAVLNDKLKREGFTVFEAKNGEEGFAAASRERPDLIIMDILMPKMHGYDCLAKIRAEEWGKETPVIFISNISNDPKAVEISKNDKNCEYLVKSDISMKIIIEKIRIKLSL
jgi:DNA-binding response OmpR family regulator